MAFTSRHRADRLDGEWPPGRFNTSGASLIQMMNDQIRIITTIREWGESAFGAAI